MHRPFVIYNIYCYRRRFVTKTFCYRRRFVKETFCRGDVLLRRRFVRRHSVEETFCKETFCMCVKENNSIPNIQNHLGAFSEYAE
jgi:hypothetical protein